MRSPGQEARSVLDLIRSDPVYLKNLHWGRPRPGHPEGTILAHIEELEANLGAISSRLSPDERERVRLLIHVHDTFKPDAAEGVPITDPRSHASLARAFLARFTSDEDLLAMVQFHDEGYALWLKSGRGRHAPDPGRLSRLLGAIRDWDTFLAFNVVDACTAGKSRGPIRWFLHHLTGRVATRIDQSWILDGGVAGA